MFAPRSHRTAHHKFTLQTQEPAGHMTCWFCHCWLLTKVTRCIESQRFCMNSSSHTRVLPVAMQACMHCSPAFWMLCCMASALLNMSCMFMLGQVAITANSLLSAQMRGTACRPSWNPTTSLLDCFPEPAGGLSGSGDTCILLLGGCPS